MYRNKYRIVEPEGHLVNNLAKTNQMGESQDWQPSLSQIFLEPQLNCPTLLLIYWLYGLTKVGHLKS